MGRTEDATARREALVDRLVAAGTVRTGEVERAMRTVPRHRFVPEVDLATAYDDRAQLVKDGDDGALSTISQPTMVAVMLELAGVRPGHRVLEIGTGTGYNAALLAHLVGVDGEVVSIDLEADLVERARTLLASLGLTQVAVHVGDGASGWPASAPFDCVIATAGVEAVPAAWREQTAVGGRLLVPMLDDRLLLVEERTAEDRWATVATSPAAFIPLRRVPNEEL